MYQEYKQVKKMAPLKFYNDKLSQPVRAVWIFLKSNNIPFEDVHIAVGKGEHKSEEYVKKFPTGKVPAMEDNGFTMIESVAILQYLCDKYSDKVAAHWYPSDIRQRARVDEVMSWQHTAIRKNGSGYFIAKFVGPDIMKTPVDDAKVEENKIALDKDLDFIENYYLKTTDYVAGNNITLADLLVICEMMQDVSIGYDVKTGRPKLAAWFDRVVAKLGPLFGEAHKSILDITKAKRNSISKLLGY